MKVITVQICIQLLKELSDSGQESACFFCFFVVVMMNLVQEAWMGFNVAISETGASICDCGKGF